MSFPGVRPGPGDRTYGVLLFAECDIDFCGPCDIFANTRLDEETRRESASPIRLLFVSSTLEAVRSNGGLRFLPDVDFTSCPPLDGLIVPSSTDIRPLLLQTEYLDFLRRAAPPIERIVAIGSGALLLAAADLLRGKSATTQFLSVDFFRERFPRTALLPELPIVTDGNITTVNSVRAAIDVAFFLVAGYYGADVARNAASQLQYPYPETPSMRLRNEK